MAGGTNYPFTIDPDRTSITIAFRNDAFIADQVLPYKPVGKQLFWWYKYGVNDYYNIVETEVGRTETVNEVEFTASRVESATIDQALDNPIPVSDIDNAPMGYDIQGRGAENTMNMVLLRREQRTASLVTTLNNYDSDKRITLSGTSQFSDYTNSLPVGVISTGLDAPLKRPNTAVMSRPVWTTLSQHPKIVNAITGQAGVVNGRVSKQAFMDLFELNSMYVGEARYNSAAMGQTGTVARLWGKHIALLYQDPLADLVSGGVTFGLTARFGDRFALSYFDYKRGAKGTEVQRVGESVLELIVGASSSYFIQNAIA